MNLGVGRYFNGHLVSHFIFGEIEAEFVRVFIQRVLIEHPCPALCRLVSGRL